MRIQHNIMAMNAYRNYTTNTSAVAKNLEKLSSGYRINRAGDDAAGLAISEKMRAQITGLSAAQKNVKDGISLVKTAEGATQEIHDMLNRMVYLAEQSANGTYQDEVDRDAIQNEFTALKTEIDRIADSSNFNGIKLLDGSLSSSGTSTTADVDLSKLSGALSVNKTVDATKHTSVMSGAVTNQTVVDGDKLTVSLTIQDASGKAQVVDLELTVGADATGAAKKALLDADGNVVKDLATAGTVTGAELSDAFLGQLQENSVIKDNFSISDNSGVLTFKAKTAGTAALNVTGIEINKITGTTGAKTVVSNGVQRTDAVDAFETIDLSNAKIYNGEVGKASNLDKAVFEINGEKFVFIDNAKVTAESLAEMKANGIEHYVEVTAAETTAGAVSKGATVKAMAEKISMETGLKVEQGATTAVAATDGYTWAAGTADTDLEISFKSNTTKVAGKGGLTLQIGDTSDDFNQLTVSISDMHAKALGIAGLDLGNQKGAQDAVATIKDAINMVSDTRGRLGATQNRLEHTQNNLSVMKENIQDAESSIRDTDIAEEMMAYTKNNILVQSAQAMLAQANQLPQGVLQLLG